MQNHHCGNIHTYRLAYGLSSFFPYTRKKYSPVIYIINTIIWGAILLLFLPLSPKAVELTADTFFIHLHSGSKAILYSSIASVTLYDTKGIREIRKFGNGGLYGYTGSFYNKRIGNYEAFVGNYNEAFLVTLKSGKKYVISCHNHLNVISALQKHLQEK